MSDQGKPWERAMEEIDNGVVMLTGAEMQVCIKRACEDHARPLVEALDEWSRLAEHLRLSTSGHRQRTRELLARYREGGDRG